MSSFDGIEDGRFAWDDETPGAASDNKNVRHRGSFGEPLLADAKMYTQTPQHAHDTGFDDKASVCTVVRGAWRGVQLT